MRVLLINGPNLDRLGVREPEVYGTTTLSQLEVRAARWAESLDMSVEAFHSNSEGEIIDAIHETGHDAIVINPGALTHTSRALADALRSIDIPAVEVHISNVKERESWRKHSVLDGVAVMSIYGRGLIGYRDALRHLANRRAVEFETVQYGPHPDNVGDLRRGAGDLVVLVHGGFWRQEWMRDTMETLAVDLTQRGHSTWNIEYRRIGTGGGWPGSGHDVLTAIEFIPRLGSDVATATVIGHSAGGHLAIWASGHARHGPGRVIGLAAVTDLPMHERSGLFGAAEARQLLDDGAPRSLAPLGVPTILFHGTEDDLVPPEHSSRVEGARRVSVSGGHFELLDPLRDHWLAVVDEIGGL